MKHFRCPVPGCTLLDDRGEPNVFLKLHRFEKHWYKHHTELIHDFSCNGCGKTVFGSDVFNHMNSHLVLMIRKRQQGLEFKTTDGNVLRFTNKGMCSSKILLTTLKIKTS